MWEFQNKSHIKTCNVVTVTGFHRFSFLISENSCHYLRALTLITEDGSTWAAHLLKACAEYRAVKMPQRYEHLSY